MFIIHFIAKFNRLFMWGILSVMVPLLVAIVSAIGKWCQSKEKQLERELEKLKDLFTTTLLKYELPEPAVSLMDWQRPLQTLYLPVEEFNRLFHITFPLIIEHLKVALRLNVWVSHKSPHAADIRMYLNQLLFICRCLKDNKIEIRHGLECLDDDNEGGEMEDELRTQIVQMVNSLEKLEQKYFPQ